MEGSHLQGLKESEVAGFTYNVCMEISLYNWK